MAIDFEAVYRARRNLKEAEKDLEELQWKSTAVASLNMSGIRVQTGYSSDRTADLVVRISAAEERVRGCKVLITRQMIRLSRIIDKIPDSKAQLYLEYRYLDCMDWEEIEKVLNYKDSAEAIKKYCERYRRKIEEKEKASERASG